MGGSYSAPQVPDYTPMFLAQMGLQAKTAAEQIAAQKDMFAQETALTREGMVAQASQFDKTLAQQIADSERANKLALEQLGLTSKQAQDAYNYQQSQLAEQIRASQAAEALGLKNYETQSQAQKDLYAYQQAQLAAQIKAQQDADTLAQQQFEAQKTQFGQSYELQQKQVLEQIAAQKAAQDLALQQYNTQKEQYQQQLTAAQQAQIAAAVQAQQSAAAQQAQQTQASGMSALGAQTAIQGMKDAAAQSAYQQAASGAASAATGGGYDYNSAQQAKLANLTGASSTLPKTPANLVGAVASQANPAMTTAASLVNQGYGNTEEQQNKFTLPSTSGITFGGG